MEIALAIVAAIGVWNWGYWIGRRQRPDDKNWNWKRAAVNEGFVHQNHLNDPTHYHRDGTYNWID